MKLIDPIRPAAAVEYRPSVIFLGSTRPPAARAACAWLEEWLSEAETARVLHRPDPRA
jgi:hypothetical protein